MNARICLFFLLVLSGGVRAQEGLTMQDTVVAKQLLQQSLEWNKNLQYRDALACADSAAAIFLQLTGPESKGVADAVYQKGRNKFALNMYEDAVVDCQQSLALRRKLFGEHNIDVAASMNFIGLSYTYLEQLDSALHYCQQAMQIRLMVLDTPHIQLALSYFNIAIVYEKMLRYDEAITYLQRALKMRIALYGSDNQDVAAIYYRLGAVNYAIGKYEEALSCYEKALEIQLKVLSPEHRDVATSFNGIAIVYGSMGAYEKAMDYTEKALQIQLKVLGPDDNSVSSSYFGLGWLYEMMGKYDQELEVLYKCMAIRLKRLGPEDTRVADIYGNISQAYLQKGIYDTAMLFQEKALEIRLKKLPHDHTDIAWSFLQMGQINNQKGLYDTALSQFQKVLDIRIRVLGNNHPEVAWAYEKIGEMYYKKDECEKSLMYYEKSLAIKIKSLGLEHPDIGTTYSCIGMNYSSLGDYEKALYYYDKSLQIRMKALGPDHPDVAWTYDNISDAYFFMTEYEKTLDYYEKALQIRLKALGSKHPDVAWSYQNIGIYFAETRGEYDRALDYYEKALQIRLESQGARHPNVGLLYLNIGAVYASKGEYDKALQYTEKSLAIQLAAFGEVHTNVANCYHNFGWISDLKKEYEKALAYYSQALKIRIKIMGPEHPYLQFLYTNIGATFTNKRDYGKALEVYEKDLSITIKAVGFQHRNTAASYVNIGRVLALQNDQAASFEYFNKSLAANFATFDTISAIRTDQDTYVSALTGIASYYQAQKNYVEAEKYGNRVVEMIKSRYVDHSMEADKALFIKDQYAVFEKLIAIHQESLKNGGKKASQNAVFHEVEMSKASLLQASFKEGNARAIAGIPDSLLWQEQHYRNTITWREKQRQTLLDKGVAETDTNTLRISSIIFDLKRDYDALKKRFEEKYPDYYRLKYDLSTVTLRYVQDSLLEPRQALLEYFVGDSSIYLFVVRPDTMIVETIQRDFPLEDWIEQFRHGLYGFHTAPRHQQTDALYDTCVGQYLEYAPKLYQKLFAPVEKWLPEQSSVIVVPDGPLGYIPFDALLTGAPKDENDFSQFPYLLHRNQFSYTYSATLLREMRDKKHRHEPTRDFVAFAPFYTGDTLVFTQDYSYTSRKNFDPLPYTKFEVGQARKKMGGDIFSGKSATEARFLELANQYRIIHLATHGVADNRMGDYAYLAFSEIKDSIENELLYVKDLYNLELNADLVVLSACETGVGKLQRGEGIISLARAFAYAGAKSIVTSLWSVNDKSTSELMGSFYNALKTGSAKDKALRDARLEYLKKHGVEDSHPFFWAAFIPIGDMQPVR